MKYYSHLNYGNKKRFIKKVRYAFAFSVIAGVIVGTYSWWDLSYHDAAVNSVSQTTSQVASAYFVPNTKIFRTPYFQFQTDKNWSEVANQHNPNEFVYRNTTNNLIRSEVTVYVDKIPVDLMATHVLPVNFREDKELLPIKVSQHCKNYSPSAKGVIIAERVNFFCNAEDTNYKVLAGLVGGGTALLLKRSDGSVSRYTIYYSDVTANLSGGPLEQIAQTFQAR